MSYLEFVEVPNPGKKTKVWNVLNKVFNKDSKVHLGKIEWKTGWRKYVFGIHFDPGYGSDYYAFDSYFDVKCMQEICTFIENQMHLKKGK